MTNLISGINKKKVLMVIISFLIAVALIALATVKIIRLYEKVTVAWPAIMFAYDNPEIVNPVREQYIIEYLALKDSIVKRQSITVSEGIESPKE